MKSLIPDRSKPAFNEAYWVSENLLHSAKKDPEMHEKICDGLDHYIAVYKQLKSEVDSNSAVASYHAHLQEEIDESLKNTKFKISCNAGCSFCCQTAVQITIDEAKLLLDYSRAAEIKIDWDRIGRQAEMKGHEDWILLNKYDRRCTFLADNGLCSVYEHRPGICRKHMVVSPAEICDIDSRGRDIVTRVSNPLVEIIACAAMTAVESGEMSKMLLKAKQ